MTVHVLYFAALRDLVETHEEVLKNLSSPLSVADLVVQLQKAHPRLVMDGVRVAVNEEFVEESHSVADGDTVALIPPVSGG